MSSDAQKTLHTKIGNLPHVMPGARSRAMVTIKLRPPMIEERPNVMNANKKSIIGAPPRSLNGGYTVQPEV